MPILGQYQALCAEGYDVYDFRNSEPGNTGFKWSDIDPEWKSWTPEQFAEALHHTIADEGFGLDMRALETCDACVYVQPCGVSASLELGYAAGAGKVTAALFAPGEPELMLKMVNIIEVDLQSLLARLRVWLDDRAVRQRSK